MELNVFINNIFFIPWTDNQIVNVAISNYFHINKKAGFKDKLEEVDRFQFSHWNTSRRLQDRDATHKEFFERDYLMIMFH